MKNIHFTKTIVLLLNFLVSCRAETPPATGSPTVTAARIPSPTPTPDPEIISPENANQLVLRMMNMGTAVGDPKYSMDRKWLYQTSTAGIYAFDTDSYQEIRLLESLPAEMLAPGDQTFPKLEPLPGFTTPPDPKQTILSTDASLIARDFYSTDLHFTGVWRLAERIRSLHGLSLSLRVVTFVTWKKRQVYQ